jgi:hypothetical protein
MQERWDDQQFFKDAMTTLSFRLEQSLKEDVNLLAEYLTRRLESKSRCGCGGQSFHCLWPGTDASAVPRFREVSGTAAHPEVAMAHKLSETFKTKDRKLAKAKSKARNPRKRK